MFEETVRPGNKMRVMPEGEDIWFETRIIRTGPDRFVVEPPTSLSEEKKYASGTTGMKLSVELMDESGVYLFDTRVVAFTNDEGLWVLQFPDNIQKMQRRRLFRLETLLNVKFKLRGDPQVYAATATDISGGGTQVVHWKDIAVGTELDLILEMPKTVLPVRGKVLNKEVLEEVSDKVLEALGIKPKFSYGIQFVRIDQLSQDEIIRYIFTRQREALRRRPAQ